MVEIRQERRGHVRRLLKGRVLHWDPYYFRLIYLGILYLPIMVAILIYAGLVALIDWMGL